MIQSLSPRIAIYATTGPGDARRYAEELARSGAPVVVAAGGDGTVNEVVNGIALAGPACGTALGILPSGTMNVFANDLGLPASRLDECWTLIEAGRTRSIDLWLANKEYFAQLAGVGLDATVIAETTWESKKKLGPFSYVLSMVRVMRRGTPILEVTAPGRPVMKGRLVLVGNGTHYGGPFRVFPDASFTDGLLDVVVVENPGVLSTARMSLAAMRNRYQPNTPGLSYFQTTELTVTTPEGVSVPVQADGDLCGATPVHFRQAAFPLRVIV